MSIIDEEMNRILKIILIGFLATVLCCQNSTDNQKRIMENKRDPIIQDCIKKYYEYLDKEGNKEYNVLIISSKHQDTTSYLITCNMPDDITMILLDSMKFVFTLENHYVFTKEDFLPSLQKLNFNNILQKIDPETYKRIQEKEVPKIPKTLWDCKFLYLVFHNEKVLRNEIRFFDTKPKMWDNNF